MPVFYLPTPDPTAIDVLANPRLSLSFTEAMISDRISKDGQVCGGKDEGDPTCGMLVLSGTAVMLEDKATLTAAEQAFAQRHPLAPWLARGGAHTRGKYVTIQIDGILLLDWYGGPMQVDIDENSSSGHPHRPPSAKNEVAHPKHCAVPSSKASDSIITRHIVLASNLLSDDLSRIRKIV